MDQGPIDRARASREDSFSDKENRKNHVMSVMPKSNLTLTQSGLLAVLLQHQRYKVFQLARRRAHRKQLQAAFWSAIRWPFRAFTARTHADDSAKTFGRTLLRHT
jgi:hypothetical protein